MLATIDLLSPSHMMYDPVIIIFMFISMYKPSQLTLPDQQTNSNLNNSFICAFLGLLPKVDLIILERENVRPSVRPQKVYSISMKFDT